jgi:cytochrome c
MNMIRLAVSMLLIGAGLAPAAAQDTGDAGQGRALARSVCAVCHAVNKETSASPMRNAPRFETLAHTPGMNAISLNAALHTSHRTMPNLVLTAPEARNIIAYIMSLK